MKKLYLNIIWPGILIGLLLPFSGKLSYSEEALTKKGAESSPPPPSAALLTEFSESVCGELLFEPDDPQGMLQLPAFDPSRGVLTGVRITTEGTLTADIFRKNLRHNDYHALFSADLKGSLPGGLELNHKAKLTYQASMNGDRQMQSGVEAFIDETTTETIEVTEALDRFYGTGHLDIPLVR